METVGDAGRIAQVMIVVEYRVGERRGHVTNLLCLCHEVQCAMLDELQDIRHTVRTMQVYIALLLTDEGLVTLRMEQFLGADEVLHNIDVRTCLDVEVAGIEESTDVQPWDKLVGLILRVGGRSLTVQVEVIALRRLQVTLLERLSVPGAVTLGDVHVVHVDGHPNVGSGIGNLVVDMCVDEEVVGLGLAVLS